MKKIDVNETLFSRLKYDYENNKNEQIKFLNGLDYFEAMIKFFGVLSISVVKNIDEDIYNEIFLTNFKISPSLGDFKSLATQPFSKSNKKKLENKHDLYDNLLKLFSFPFSNIIELDMADDIIEDNIKDNKKKISTLWDLFEKYVVNFRNKLKGHGASFNENDEKQSKIILDNLDIVIKKIELKIYELLEDENLSFHVLEEINSQKEHNALKVIVKYKDEVYQLSPLIIYLECNKYSCKDNHKIKLFFYNDGKASKSYYLDYSHNHYYYFSSNNEINSSIQAGIASIQKKINSHNTSDNKRNSDLLSIFVGREEELKISKKHILNGIESNSSAGITVIGKPGTGKSAFISKLQDELKVEFNKQEKLSSYIFYAKKSNMGDDENKFFYNQIKEYISSLNIKITIEDKDMTGIERLVNLFNFCNEQLTEPLLLVIDGLDEFKNPISFLENFPLSNFPNKIQIVFSTRPYSNILDILQEKLLNSEIKILNRDTYKQNSSSLLLTGLKKKEVEVLIGQVLSKDILRDSIEYKIIQDQIFDISEGLPLYIYYISNQLIEFDVKSQNITEEILKYSKDLPPGLEDFYFQAFKSLDTVSSNILYMLYFCPKAVSFDSFYNLILLLLNKSEFELDKKEFHNKYFSSIEMFLSINHDNNYKFYHLSVKESIKSYFSTQNNFKDIIEIEYNGIIIKDYQISQYKALFDEFYYIKEEAILFKILNKLQQILKGKKNDNTLSQFYINNYLTLYYQLIFFKLFQETITFKDIENKDYSKFDQFIISNSLNDEITNFFIEYEQSDKINIDEIKFAHELAMLIKDYEKVKKYSLDYEKAFINFFIEIVFNIDESLNKRIFHKHIKQNLKQINDDIKLIILYHPKMKNLTNLEEVHLIIDSFDDLNKKSKIAKYLDISFESEEINIVLNYIKKIDYNEVHELREIVKVFELILKTETSSDLIINEILNILEKINNDVHNVRSKKELILLLNKYSNDFLIISRILLIIESIPLDEVHNVDSVCGMLDLILDNILDDDLIKQIENITIKIQNLENPRNVRYTINRIENVKKEIDNLKNNLKSKNFNYIKNEKTNPNIILRFSQIIDSKEDILELINVYISLNQNNSFVESFEQMNETEINKEKEIVLSKLNQSNNEFINHLNRIDLEDLWQIRKILSVNENQKEIFLNYEENKYLFNKILEISPNCVHKIREVVKLLEFYLNSEKRNSDLTLEKKQLDTVFYMINANKFIYKNDLNFLNYIKNFNVFYSTIFNNID